jgi:hypothetical protein
MVGRFRRSRFIGLPRCLPGWGNADAPLTVICDSLTVAHLTASSNIRFGIAAALASDMLGTPVGARVQTSDYLTANGASSVGRCCAPGQNKWFTELVRNGRMWTLGAAGTPRLGVGAGNLISRHDGLGLSERRAGSPASSQTSARGGARVRAATLARGTTTDQPLQTRPPNEPVTTQHFRRGRLRRHSSTTHSLLGTRPDCSCEKLRH